MWLLHRGLVGEPATGVQTLHSAERLPGPWPGPEAMAASGQTVALPDVWRRQQPKLSGLHHYRLQLPAPSWQGPSAIYIPRLGNRARIWVDGQLLARFGDLAQGQQDYSPRPLLLGLPAGAQPRQLVIELAGQANRFSGLSQLHWGPAEPLAARHAQRDNALLAGAGLAGGGGLLLALFGAVGAWRLRLPMLGFFALAGLAAGTRALLWMWREPTLPHLLWYAAMDLCFGLWACCIAWFALRAVRLRLRALEWALSLLLLMMLPATLMAGLGGGTALKELWLNATLAVAGLITLLLLRRAWQRPDGVALALALGAVTVVSLSALDHWNIFFSTATDAYVRPYFSHHMALLFGLFMAGSLAARFDAAVRNEAVLRGSLRSQVQAQRHQLLALHAREQAHLSQAVAQGERQRILQDMHDGLGAHLSNLLGQVQRGALPAPELEREVIEAIDQLRISVDAASLDGASATEVLAQLRFRLAPRFKRLGVAVDWQLPTGAAAQRTALDVGQATQLQHIVLEALANSLRHAEPRQLAVQLQLEADGSHTLSVRDDGRKAWDPAQASQGKGLRNLQRRALALGGQLALAWQPGVGSSLQLRWRSGP